MKKTDLLKDYYTKIKDVPRIKLTAELETVRGYIRSTEGNISRMESDLESYRAESAEYEAQEKLIGKRIEALPVVEPMKGSMVGKDLAKALALPFVSSIAMNGTDIIFTTKPNTLKTKLVKKLDGANMVEVEPYYIFLPSYRIRVGMDRVYETLANTEHALSMKLVEAGKREEFLNNVGWVWEPHAHWSTTCSIENGYRKVCLGEYESEVTQSIRKGLTDFLLSFSIFLQTAGANNSHVSIGKEYWALWLGKNEYNKAITL